LQKELAIIYDVPFEAKSRKWLKPKESPSLLGQVSDGCKKWVSSKSCKA